MEKFSKIIQIATSEVKKENPKCFPKSDVLFRILLEFLGEDWYENYITKCNYEGLVLLFYSFPIFFTLLFHFFIFFVNLIESFLKTLNC